MDPTQPSPVPAGLVPAQASVGGSRQTDGVQQRDAETETLLSFPERHKVGHVGWRWTVGTEETGHGDTVASSPRLLWTQLLKTHTCVCVSECVCGKIAEKRANLCVCLTPYSDSASVYLCVCVFVKLRNTTGQRRTHPQCPPAPQLPPLAKGQRAQ